MDKQKIINECVVSFSLEEVKIASSEKTKLAYALIRVVFVFLHPLGLYLHVKILTTSEPCKENE